MNVTDYIAMLLVLVAGWGLTTSIPNLSKARAHKARLKRERINGFTARLAQKEVRLHYNITRALVYILVLGVTVAMPTVRFWDTTLAGLLLTLGLIYACWGLAMWSRVERDDGESAHLELLRLATDRLKEMEAHHEG